MSVIAYGNVSVCNINDGTNAKAYNLSSSTSLIVLDEDGKCTPSQITLNSKKSEGTSFENYSGRFKIETSGDNENWTTQYTSSANESSKTYTLPSSIVDEGVYNFRKTGDGKGVGSKEEDVLVGGSLVWNQLVRNGNFEDDISGWTIGGRSTYSVDSNVLTYTVSNDGVLSSTISRSINIIETHKYIVMCDVMCSENNQVRIRYPFLSSVKQLSANSWDNVSFIGIANANQTTCGIQLNAISTATYKIKNIQCIDLTTFFGNSTIADYVYSLEQSTSGAGIAWLRKYFPKIFEWHEYDAGTMIHVSGLQSHRMVGWNQWDEEWELGGISLSTGAKETATNTIRSKNYISVIPDAVYYFKCPTSSGLYGRLFWYDAEHQFISYNNAVYNNTRQAPSNARYLLFQMTNAYGTTYNHDICINLSDPSRNGQYEPYEKHSYPLDSTITLRGIPKLVDGKLVADGDWYEPSGDVTVRYGIVDLGDLNWTYESDWGGSPVFYSSDLTLAKRPAHDNLSANMISGKYVNLTRNEIYNSSGDGMALLSGGSFRVRNSSYSDATAFKTAMSGVMLVYEKATPTSSQAQPFSSPQTCDPNGTEEYVSTSIVPVGHNTTYTPNIKLIRASLYQAGGTTTLLDQITIPVLENMVEQVFLVKTVPEYTLSTTSTSIPSDATWLETKPTIDSSHYLWTRQRSDFSDGSSTYSNAVCDVVITGIVTDVNKNTNSITNKVWQSDINTSINTYDGSTVANIRNRVSQTEQDISGITTRVADVESETDDLGTRMTSAESSITQNANNINLKVNKNGVISEINQSPESITINANRVNIAGDTLFTSGRLSQTSLNNAYDSKGSASAVQTNLDNLEIGGRNIIRCSLPINSQGNSYWTNASNHEFATEDGYPCIHFSGELNISKISIPSFTVQKGANSSIFVPQSGQQIVFSADVKMVNVVKGTTNYFIGLYGSGETIDGTWRSPVKVNDGKHFVNNTNSDALDPSKLNGNGWTRVYIICTYSSQYAWSRIQPCLYARDFTGDVYFKNIKFEIGNKPTDWSPAPEDVASTSIKETVPCYYRSTTSTTPTISSSTSIGTSNNSDNAWSYVMPLPKRDRYFFICEKYVYADSSIAFSTVRPLDSQTYASKWVSSSDNTYIDGGRIYTHSITTSQLATDAIKSNNYQAAASGPYSATGTFLDLSNGNFYTPNFGVQSLTGKAYLNGEIIATSGSIGDDSGNYWSIGNTIDAQGNGSASIVGNGTAYIQDGDWQIHSGLSNYSNGSINTQWYVQPQGQGLQLTYPYYDGYYYDYGMTSPVLDANSDKFYNQTVSQNFLYIRKHASTIPALESDWNYIFRIDKDGMIWINGQSLTQMIQSGVDGGAYLPTSGGTVNGNVTITGTLTATASKANQLTHTLSINGKGFDGSGDVNVGTIGAAYGGTGQTSLVNSANALLNALSTGSDIPKDNDYYISQYVNGGTSTTTYHRRPVSKLWEYIKSKLTTDHSNLDDLYVLKSGDTITGSLTVENGLNSDSAQLGDLIVTGAGRFANGLYGDLIGNADTATKAAKVADSGNGTETTFAYSKSGLTTTSWIAAWNGYELRAISPANLLTTIGADKSASISDRINATGNGNYNWTSSTYDDKLITSNTLAYWNGAYNSSSHASNIEYVKLGKLGALSIKDSLSASDVGAVAKSGDTMTGALITATNKYYESNNEYGINMSNSDLVGINGIYTMDKCDSFNEGIHFYRDSTHWDSLYARDGRLYFVPNREKNTAGNSKNVIIEGDNIPESSLVWGDKSFTASYSVGDVYFNDYLRANRLAGVRASAVSVEYSTDGGSTWNTYQSDDLSKRNLFTAGSAFYIGGSGSGTVTANSQLRITLDFYEGSIYTVLRKLMIYVSTNYSQNCQVTITASKGSSPDDYSLKICENQSIAGWSGWNVIPCNFTTYGNTPSSQYQKIRFVFTNTGLSDSSKKGGLSIGRIYGYGGVGWTTPSTLALNGHVYSFDGNLNVTFPSNVTATSFNGNASSASKLNSTRSFTIGKTAKNVDWSGAVSFSQAEISDNASTTAAGWMSKDDKVKLNGIETGAQVNSITGVKGNSESSYRTGNVNITAANIGLGNLTNDKQVKGLSSGTTSGNLLKWGADGYTVADTGMAADNIITSVGSTNDGKLRLTYLSGNHTDIEVQFVAYESSSVRLAEALNVNGTAVGGADEPVYFSNQGKPTKANKIPKLNNGITGGTFYAPTSAGTSGQILQSNGGTPSWVAQSTLSVGSATIAGAFSSNASVTLTGDTTGTASSTKGWSITTKTDRLSPVGDNRNDNTTPNDYNNRLIFQGLKYNSKIGTIDTTDNYSYVVGLRGWNNSSGGNSHELAFNNHGIFRRDGATTTWGDWYKLLDTGNYTDYTVKKDGTGATGTWGISINGNANTATTATTATKANITTVTNSVAKYSDTSGTFTDSYITIDSSGNLIIGDNDHPANVKIGAKNDNYGLMPNVNNYNQIGSSSLNWWRAYVTNYYGSNSHVNNWDSDKNIGTPSAATVASTLGNVNFYNTCAAGGTQTKTKLTADAGTASNITVTLPKETGTLALTKNYQPYAHYSNTNSNNSGKYYKISINSYIGWMLNFTVKLYHSYRAYDIQISGYNYGSNYWYQPNAFILGASNTSVNVLFGYDSDYHLWIAIPAESYTGIDIINVTNGYLQVDSLEGLFTIEMVDGEPTTVQQTITAYRPWYRNETVSNAVNATNATNASIATKSGNSSIYMYPEGGNEINFGGTNTTTTIYFGFRAKDSRSLPEKYVFSGSTGTADLQAKTLYLGSGTTSYISGTDYTGNAATATLATKATQDGSGNTITSYYCTLSTNQTISGTKTFSAMPLSSAGICVNSGGSGSAGGVSLWSDKNVKQYGIALRATSDSGKHGYVQQDYAIYNYIYAASAGAQLTRGWVFKDSVRNQGVASISGAGNAVFDGSVTIGGNATNTSGVEMVFDETLSCLNFIFN